MTEHERARGEGFWVGVGFTWVGVILGKILQNIF